MSIKFTESSSSSSSKNIFFFFLQAREGGREGSETETAWLTTRELSTSPLQAHATSTSPTRSSSFEKLAAGCQASVTVCGGVWVRQCMFRSGHVTGPYSRRRRTQRYWLAGACIRNRRMDSKINATL